MVAVKKTNPKNDHKKAGKDIKRSIKPKTKLFNNDTKIEMSTEDAQQSHQMQKLLRLQRRANKTPVFELIQELKKMWEQLRMKSLPKKDRQQVVSQTMRMVKGHVVDVIFKHDSSRIIQSLIKYSDPSDEEYGRSVVLGELQGKMVDLAKSPYGRFIVLKSLKYAPNAIVRSQIISEFLKDAAVVQLIKHKHADLIIDSIYCLYANAREKKAMVEQFYGLEYSIVKAAQDQPTLSKILINHPDARERILEQMKHNLQSIVTKEGAVGRNEIVHRVLYEYFTELSLQEFSKVVRGETAPFFPLLVQIPSFIHTKFGSRLSLLLLAGTTAKERKGILKTLKPHAKKIALNEYGWHVICRIFTCVDDTVLVKNCISNELLGGKTTEEIVANVKEILESKTAHKILLHLLCGNDTKLFSPDLIQTLSSGSVYVEQTSKKPSEQRKRELLAFIVPQLIKGLSNDSEMFTKCLTDLNLTRLVGEISTADDFPRDLMIELIRNNYMLVQSKACCRLLREEGMKNVAREIIDESFVKKIYLEIKASEKDCWQHVLFMFGHLIEQGTIDASVCKCFKQLSTSAENKGLVYLEDKIKKQQ